MQLRFSKDHRYTVFHTWKPEQEYFTVKSNTKILGLVYSIQQASELISLYIKIDKLINEVT